MPVTLDFGTIRNPYYGKSVPDVPESAISGTYIYKHPNSSSKRLEIKLSFPDDSKKDEFIQRIKNEEDVFMQMGEIYYEFYAEGEQIKIRRFWGM